MAPRYYGYQPPRAPDWKDWSEASLLYILQGGPYVKIGVARDVKRRIAALQCGCPFKLKRVAARSAPLFLIFQIERRLHAEFAGQRMHGEWFEADIAEVKAALQRQINEAVAARNGWLRDGFVDWAIRFYERRDPRYAEQLLAACPQGFKRP